MLSFKSDPSTNHSLFPVPLLLVVKFDSVLSWLGALARETLIGESGTQGSGISGKASKGKLIETMKPGETQREGCWFDDKSSKNYSY